MTRAKALEELAVKVMGWRVANTTPDGLVIAPAQEFKPLYRWNPFIDPAQALDLAEAWRAKSEKRWWQLNSPQIPLGYAMFGLSLTAPHPEIDGGMAYAESPVLAAALTLGVCAAEGIEVEE